MTNLVLRIRVKQSRDAEHQHVGGEVIQKHAVHSVEYLCCECAHYMRCEQFGLG